MKKILLSLSMIGAVAVLAIGATGAFFSDSETSTGNTFAAGAIDLQIDNESYVTSTTTGQLVASANTSWTLRDLTIERFFDFDDVKPGDIGEDTISLHVNNNDSWLCVDVTLTSDDDNTCTEPEGSDEKMDANGATTTPSCNTQGELADNINFIWWADDGDNVLEQGENVLEGGPLGALSVDQTAYMTLADSQMNIWANNATGTPLVGGSERFIGKAWCFGAISSAAVTQDGFGKTGQNGPLVRGTGVSCDGAAGLNNVTQTDSMTADVSFYAVQSRNNPGFICSQRNNSND